MVGVLCVACLGLFVLRVCYLLVIWVLMLFGLHDCGFCVDVLAAFVFIDRLVFWLLVVVLVFVV